MKKLHTNKTTLLDWLLFSLPPWVFITLPLNLPEAFGIAGIYSHYHKLEVGHPPGAVFPYAGQGPLLYLQRQPAACFRHADILSALMSAFSNMVFNSGPYSNRKEDSNQDREMHRR